MAAPVLGPGSPVDIKNNAGVPIYSWSGALSVCALSDTLMVSFGDMQPASTDTFGYKAQAVSVGTDGSITAEGAWVAVDGDYFDAVTVTKLTATTALVCSVPNSDQTGRARVLTVDPATLAITVGADVVFQPAYTTVTGPDGLYQKLHTYRDYKLSVVGLTATTAVVFYEYDRAKTSGFLDQPGPTNQRQVETRCCVLSISGTTVTAATPVSIAGPKVRGYTDNGPASGVNSSSVTVFPNNDGTAAYLDGAVQRYEISSGSFASFFRDQAVKLSSTRAAYLFWLPAVNIEDDGYGSTYVAVVDVSGTTATVTHIWRVSKGRLYYFAGATHTYAYIDAQDGGMPMALGVAGGKLVVAENFWVRSHGVTDPVIVWDSTAETAESTATAGYYVNVKSVDPDTGTVGTATVIGNSSGGTPVLVPTGDGRCLLGFYEYSAPGLVYSTWQYLSVGSGGAVVLDTALDTTAVQSDDFWWTRAAPAGAAAAFVQDSDSSGAYDGHAQYYTVGSWAQPDLDLGQFIAIARPEAEFHARVTDLGGL